MAKYNDLTVGQMEAAINKMGGWENFQAFLRDEYTLTKVAKAVAAALLTMIGTVSIAATPTEFVTSEKFVVNTKASAKVKISYVGDNFKTWFSDKVEAPFAGSELCYQKLAKNSRDLPIIEELGGEEKAETTLTEMFALMERQGHGQEGALLNNGWANIFYVRDVNALLRTVRVSWRNGSWGVPAFPIDRPNGWLADRQVFSRNSATV